MIVTQLGIGANNCALQQSAAPLGPMAIVPGRAMQLADHQATCNPQASLFVRQTLRITRSTTANRTTGQPKLEASTAPHTVLRYLSEPRKLKVAATTGQIQKGRPHILKKPKFIDLCTSVLFPADASLYSLAHRPSKFQSSA